MGKNSKIIASITTSGLMVAGIGMSASSAIAANVEAEPSPQNAAVIAAGVSDIQEVANVEGTFSFTQRTISSIEDIKKSLADASQVLCGSQLIGGSDIAAEDWSIKICGNVDNPYSMTGAELQKDPDVLSVIMGCSCAGNPADGRASINAEVTGVAVKTLIDKASVQTGANTIVFTSADGYEVALPLDYVVQRYCPLVFDVNGSPIAESMGGTNQLWLGSTSAKYFARNIVSIELETRDNPVAAPDSESENSEFSNLPNIGIAFGGEIQ